MIEDCCPVPSKKSKTLLFSDSSENEDINLSPSFDETYQSLMKNEMVTFCQKQCNSTNDFNPPNNLTEFYKKCDDLQLWFETAVKNNKRELLCNCDVYLEKINHSRQILQSSRFTNLKMLGNVVISREPQLQDTINSKLQHIENQWHSNGLFTDLTICHVLEDINEDIADLSSWLSEVKQKLNFDTPSTNRKRDFELIEVILRNFEIHNEIRLSVTKIITELQELDPPSVYFDQVYNCKSTLEYVESDMYQLWLNAIEYKLRLDDHDGEIATIGQESGFESELSPIYSAKRLCRINHAAMNYISSGDDISDYTTEAPLDSQSAEITIDTTHLSSSSSYHSSRTMLEASAISVIPHKRIIRRKKRRSKKIDKTDRPNLSTEESESYWKNDERCAPKRRINEVGKVQMSDVVVNSGNTLNYLEIANAAEKLVKKSSSRTEYQSYESPKESEIEDIIDMTKRSLNDIDVDKNWDYYQAAMYSNEEGDSQLIELDNIKDWEPELDTDGLEVAATTEEPPKPSDKRLSILTSGYETNMESDPTICSKVLCCVLQFTTKHYQDLDKKIADITMQQEKLIATMFESLLNAITGYIAKADIHLKLLRDIQNYDPCVIAHNKNLIDNLTVMENCWDRIKTRCLMTQLNLVEDRMKYLDCYRDADELRASVDSLQVMISTLNDVRVGVSKSGRDAEKLGQRIQVIGARLATLKDTRCKELELVLCSLACVAQSKCARRLLACELRLTREGGSPTNVNVRDLYNKFEKCIVSLKKCSEDIDGISSAECRTFVSREIDTEIRAWQNLCDGARNNMPPLADISVEEMECLQLTQSQVHDQSGTRTVAASRGGLFRQYLPLHVAIIAIVSVIGWWYSHSSASNCHSSVSGDWMRLFYRNGDHIEPH